MSANEFDLIVIGSGPAGQKGAIAAAKLHKRVAIIDRREMIGGCSLHLGTIPSKTLREAILYLSGIRQRSFYGTSYRVKEDIAAADLMSRVRMVLTRETEVVCNQLRRNGVVTFHGTAHFADPHTIDVTSVDGVRRVHGERILIACGTRPAENAAIPTDGRRIFNSDQLLDLEELPRELIVVGGGVVGLEYASMFAALNTRVTLIDQRPTLLEFADRELIETLSYHLRSQGVTFRLGEQVASVQVLDEHRVEAQLESGKIVRGDSLLYAVGRQANTDTLCLDNAGVPMDARGRIDVNEHFQSPHAPHIYAAGDVVGFPALAASSMEQGRLASAHMFGTPGRLIKEHMPYGIYTIPEISMVGACEQTLTAQKVRYEVGIAKFCELAKGQMVGDEIGLLKLIFDPDSRALLGVHVIGENATEIIHIGQAVIALGGTIEYFRDAMFNYPTLAEAYKVAALNGLNKL